jgi:hypothetical protein
MTARSVRLAPPLRKFSDSSLHVGSRAAVASVALHRALPRRECRVGHARELPAVRHARSKTTTGYNHLPVKTHAVRLFTSILHSGAVAAH